MVASSSRPRPPSDVFRPRLPLDPFAHIDRLRPWPVHAHALPDLLLDSAHRRSVVLILGEPPAADLAPLLSSIALSSSLLLIATHAPHTLALPPSLPSLSASTGPAVRILRLSAPLAVQEAGALRLVSLFERAERVAHTWRTAAHKDKRILQLAEAGPGGEFVIVEEHGTRPASAPKQPLERYPSPTPSTTSSTSTHQKPAHKFRTAPSSAASSTSSLLSSQTHVPKKSKPKSKSRARTRPFDAILNFLPASVADKSLLKHAILVTTLSAPFLVCAPGTLPPSAFQKKQNRASVFSIRAFSSSEVSINEGGKRFSAIPVVQPQQTEQRTKLVHVLPHTYHHHASAAFTPSSSRASSFSSQQGSFSPHLLHPHPPSAKSQLAQSIEQFLLSFADPLPSLSLSPSPLPPPTDTGATDKPTPYLLAPRVFGHPVGASKLCVGELLLLGALDPSPSSSPSQNMKEAPRAWIGDAHDVRVLGAPEAEVDIEGNDGKGKGKARQPHARPKPTPTGLPTPPESESSLESAGLDDDDDNDEGVEEGVEQWSPDPGYIYESPPPPPPPGRGRRSSDLAHLEEEDKYHFHPPQHAGDAPPPQGYEFGMGGTRASQVQVQVPVQGPGMRSSGTGYAPPAPPNKLRRKSSAFPSSSSPPTASYPTPPLSSPTTPTPTPPSTTTTKERKRVSSFFGLRSPPKEKEEGEKPRKERSGMGLRRFWGGEKGKERERVVA